MDFQTHGTPEEEQPPREPSPKPPWFKTTLIISGGLVATLVVFAWWKAGETHRQIQQWSRDRNSAALVSFVREHSPKSEAQAEVAFAFQQLEPLAGERDSAALEALFYRLTSRDEITLGILRIFQRQNQAFRDADKAVTWWIDPPGGPGPSEIPMRAMLGRMPARHIHGAFLAEIGRRYAAGDKEGAINASRRFAATPPAPEAADLVSLLTSYKEAESRLPSQHEKIRSLDSDIADQQKVIARFNFVTLTAFLVDRLPKIGNNVYEIATFSWTGYSLQRKETAILTCNGTTFNTKGRFTMTVRPTGMKSFTQNFGGSMELPTFEEVSYGEITQKELAERELIGLYGQKGQTYREISQLEERISQNNVAIKTKLGWNGEPTLATQPEAPPAAEGESAPPPPPPSAPPSRAAEFDFSQMKVKYWPPMPPYPPLAKIARIQGTVVVEITMDTDGNPKSTRSLEGPPQLREAAESYAMKWKFQPALQNGKPTAATFKMSIPYKLK